MLLPVVHHARSTVRIYIHMHICNSNYIIILIAVRARLKLNGIYQLLHMRIPVQYNIGT